MRFLANILSGKAFLKRAALIPALFFAACSTFNQQASQDSDARFSRAEIRVIEALLHSKHSDAIQNGRTLVLSQQTSTGLTEDSVKFIPNSRFNKTDERAVLDFNAKNKQPYPVPDRFDSNIKVRLLSSDAQKDIWKDRDGWNRFYRLYPEAPGLITISRVGFSRDGKTALVYYDWRGDGLLGFGGVYVLRLVRWKWEMTAETVGDTWNA